MIYHILPSRNKRFKMSLSKIVKANIEAKREGKTQGQ
jgi:hypothetical protein